MNAHRERKLGYVAGPDRASGNPNSGARSAPDEFQGARLLVVGETLEIDAGIEIRPFRQLRFARPDVLGRPSRGKKRNSRSGQKEKSAEKRNGSRVHGAPSVVRIALYRTNGIRPETPPAREKTGTGAYEAQRVRRSRAGSGGVGEERAGCWKRC